MWNIFSNWIIFNQHFDLFIIKDCRPTGTFSVDLAIVNQAKQFKNRSLGYGTIRPFHRDFFFCGKKIE